MRRVGGFGDFGHAADLSDPHNINTIFFTIQKKANQLYFCMCRDFAQSFVSS
jgi:hypothetical protein